MRQIPATENHRIIGNRDAELDGTLTVIPRVGKEVSPATAVVLVHVTVTVTAPQVQPVPVLLANV